MAPLSVRPDVLGREGFYVRVSKRYSVTEISALFESFPRQPKYTEIPNDQARRRQRLTPEKELVIAQPDSIRICLLSM